MICRKDEPNNSILSDGNSRLPLHMMSMNVHPAQVCRYTQLTIQDSKTCMCVASSELILLIEPTRNLFWQSAHVGKVQTLPGIYEFQGDLYS